jgi:hypothetical protein
MTTLMQRGASWLAGKLQAAAGRSVTLHWRNKSVAVTGTVTLQQYEVVDENGLTTLVESWDWTFTAAELLLDGQSVRPTKGYWLSETLNSEEVRYDVMPVGSKPPTETVDAFETLVVVHTKRAE